jgi:hypothetical protein
VREEVELFRSEAHWLIAERYLVAPGVDSQLA